LLKDLYTDAGTMARAGTGAELFACPGSTEITTFSQTGRSTFNKNLDGYSWAFFGGAKYESQGIYFNSEYDLSPDWTLFGGIRHDRDSKDRNQVSFASATARHPNGTNCNTNLFQADCFTVVGIGVKDSSVTAFAGKGDGEWSKTTWNVGFEYRPIDTTMIYGRISTGYRAGGFFGYGTSQAPWTYDAEEMTNYETGVKGLYFDGRVQLATSVFYQDFDKYWVYTSRLKTQAEQQIDPNSGPLTGEVTSITGTKIYGVEVEGAWRITDSLSLRGFYNYLHTSVGDFPALYQYEIPGQAGNWVALPWTNSAGVAQTSWIFGSPDPVQFGGKQLPNQPTHKGSLTLAYDVPMPADMGRLEVLTIADYRGKKYVELLNVESYAVDPYTRWDMRVNWTSPTSTWLVTGYVQNLLNQAALHLWSPREGTGSPWGTIVEPREIGISVTWQNL
jgi:outer membrane receptor protein involved in Fe transport